MALNEQAGQLIARSAREATRLGAAARASARGRGARAKLRAASQLEELAERCVRCAGQIDRRARDLKITDRLVSISDPDARPIRKGKLGKPTEFGYVAQICEVTENTRARCARVHPPRRPRAGQPGREPAAAPDRRRARASRDPTARDRRRRRVRGRHRPARRSQTSPTTRSRSPAATNPAAEDPQTPRALPDRDRGPHQSPQTPPRAAALPTQRR